jgi:hypothetical protein
MHNIAAKLVPVVCEKRIEITVNVGRRQWAGPVKHRTKSVTVLHGTTRTDANMFLKILFIVPVYVFVSSILF